MNKILPVIIFFFIFFSLSSFLNPIDASAEKEDTAHLSFEKKIGTKHDDITYKVKRGEWLADIIRKETKLDSYKDIYRIIQKVKTLNPKIKNLNLLHPGQVLRMPENFFSNTDQKQGTSRAEAGEQQTAQIEQSEITSIGLFVKDEKNLSILKRIISNINGTLIINGLYHIPLPHSGQVTIDCEKIPVAELDDGSISLLDFSNGMPDSFKNLIMTSWKHYHIIPYNNNDTIISIVQKIIRSSKAYDFIKMTKLFNVPNSTSVQLYCDWVIVKKQARERQEYIQALSVLRDESELLPLPIINYAEKSSLIVTEIVGKQGILKSKPHDDMMLNITNLNAKTNQERIFSLLSILGFKPEKDVDINPQNNMKDSGYNLSIKVDYLVQKDGRNYVINNPSIQKEVLDILKKAEYKIIPFDENEKPSVVIDKILRTMNFDYSNGTFSFTFPEKGITRASINLPAFRVTGVNKEPIFLIENEMDNELYGFIQSIWRLKLIKY